MPKVTVSLPQGTRDFSADVVRKRHYIINTIKNVFELYGFAPLETPAMENLETLMGKYGNEGDKLLFKILNNGINDEKNIEKSTAAFNNILQGNNDKNLTERALKYDLTIPFARYVAMNYGQLTLPYKRYQIQPVWRADRPQKGRYREFYQCDADIVGSTSSWNEVELICMYAKVFELLNIKVTIKINSRKILAALAYKCGDITQLTTITTAIDKLDKIGIEKVKDELLQNGLSNDAITTIEKYLTIAGTNEEKIATLQQHFGEAVTEVTTELKNLLTATSAYTKALELDLTLARGLNYYTGCIFEIKATDVPIGSIGGGGRYDDLTTLFGVPNLPGVGISFGLDRIYDVMETLQLFPTEIVVGSTVLFFNTGNAEASKAFELIMQLRQHNISAELYHETAKFDKQFKYAEKKQIPYIAIIGTNEMLNNTCLIKELATSTQTEILQLEVLNYFTKK